MNQRVKLLLIAAMCKNRGIGKNNDLPWRLPKELAYYTRMTKDTIEQSKKNIVIMGRRTWETLPPKFRPLPGRINIVISRQADYSLPEGTYLAGSLDEAVALTQREDLRDRFENVWVLGGEQIYREALKSPLCHRVYLTHIDATYECDTFFPEFNCPGEFKEMEDDRVPKGVQEEKGVTYEFKVYERV